MFRINLFQCTANCGVPKTSTFPNFAACCIFAKKHDTDVKKAVLVLFTSENYEEELKGMFASHEKNQLTFMSIGCPPESLDFYDVIVFGGGDMSVFKLEIQQIISGFNKGCVYGVAVKVTSDMTFLNAFDHIFPATEEERRARHWRRCGDPVSRSMPTFDKEACPRTASGRTRTR